MPPKITVREVYRNFSGDPLELLPIGNVFKFGPLTKMQYSRSGIPISPSNLEIIKEGR
jgi:hypothetical protein